MLRIFFLSEIKYKLNNFFSQFLKMFSDSYKTLIHTYGTHYAPSGLGNLIVGELDKRVELCSSNYVMFTVRIKYRLDRLEKSTMVCVYVVGTTRNVELYYCLLRPSKYASTRTANLHGYLAHQVEKTSTSEPLTTV